MAIKSISEFYSFSLYVFDLDNTIYKEEDYLFEAYKNIAASIVTKLPNLNEEVLYLTLLKLYESEGRTRLFNKFLTPFDPEEHFLQDCLHILRSFRPEGKYAIFPEIKPILSELIFRKKIVYILTNGNPEQQRNKINNIQWEGLDRSMSFLFADELEPKPSPAGVEYILKNTGVDKNHTIMIGDSEDDRICAGNSFISFIDVKVLSGLSTTR
jgi:HAD superfamily hydrolase (TIGR01549 family)